LDTATVLVPQAAAGYLVEERAAAVPVPVKDALRQLVQSGRLARRELDGRSLYCAVERTRSQEQWAARQAQAQPDPELQAAVGLFYSLWDEQQRRLYAGLASRRWGHGGDRRLAQLLGLDVGTVARGRHELWSGQVVRERIRQAGGGRPRVEKKLRKS
jgi:hypothetical protein